MKRILLLLLSVFLLSGCMPAAKKNDTLKIVATLFPQYDFAREICGDTAEISLLLPPGTDSHSYDPTPQDILRLQEADLVLYTGDEMEPWAKQLVDNASGRVIDVSEGVSLLSGDHMHESRHHEEASESTDPHIWTNPQNAIIMAENILKAVKQLAAIGIKTNVTLIFSAAQALLAARAGASYVSPFVGRLDDISDSGIDLVADIAEIFAIHDIKTEIISASIRGPQDVTDSAKAGAHIATVPYKVIQQMTKHPLTDIGIQRFMDDWNKTFNK